MRSVSGHTVPAPSSGPPADGARVASRPPEARGLARDEVRLLVASPAEIRHARFRDLGEELQPGDLVVVNTSDTLPAAVDGVRAGGEPVVVHVSSPRPDGTWVVELRRPDGRGPVRDGRVGEVVVLVSGTELRLDQPEPTPGSHLGPRLWRVRLRLDGPLEDELGRIGRPVAYGYLDGRWPLSAYRTVFGRHPGSAEMASAGRPFTDRMVTDLVTRGIVLAPVRLHAGVSSLEVGEPPQPERFEVPAATARLVEHTRRSDRRVVAVGTTVVRALESAARPDGAVEPARGWTDLVLGPRRRARVVDGLVTGWHERDSSHLALLEAVAGTELVTAAYEVAASEGYLLHEFGDSCLLLPARRSAGR